MDIEKLKKGNCLGQVFAIFVDQKLNFDSYDEFNKIYDLIFKKAQYSLSRKINKINHYVNTEVT